MNSRLAFVVVGMAINLLVLGRGILLMTVLDYKGLGLIALVQSYILFGGMLHFGLLNGGYRLLCHATERHKQRIINLAYSAFGALGAVIAIIALIIAIQMGEWEYRVIAGLTALGGIATLLRSWMMNEMLASGKLKAANIINAAAISLSLGLLIFLPLGPTVVAVGSIVAQPVLFAVFALISGSVLRPQALRVPKRLAIVIFRTGFVLFLTGIAVQFNSLVERTYVSGELGLEPLGRLYLAFLFLTLFQMVPNLLEQVFLPNIVRAYKASDGGTVKSESRNLLLLIAGYCVVGGLALWLLAPVLLELVLPKYVADLRWVYLLTPGLFIFALSAPFALMFNVVIRYRWYVIAYTSSIAVTLAIFGAAFVAGQALSLDGVIILRSAVYAIMAVLLVAGWWRLSREYRIFRWLGPGAGGSQSAQGAA